MSNFCIKNLLLSICGHSESNRKETKYQFYLYTTKVNVSILSMLFTTKLFNISIIKYLHGTWVLFPKIKKMVFYYLLMQKPQSCSFQISLYIFNFRQLHMCMRCFECDVYNLKNVSYPHPHVELYEYTLKMSTNLTFFFFFFCFFYIFYNKLSCKIYVIWSAVFIHLSLKKLLELLKGYGFACLKHMYVIETEVMIIFLSPLEDYWEF